MTDSLTQDHRRFTWGVIIVALSIFGLGFGLGAAFQDLVMHHYRCDEGLYWNGHQCALVCPPTGCW